MKTKLFFGVLVSVFLFVGRVFAQGTEFPHFPVIELDREEGIIGIFGEIDVRTPLSFEIVVGNIPNPQVLILDSPGGSVHSALTIASRVHGMKMATLILEEGECFSACSMIFLAGRERYAFGALGVHQISSSNGQANWTAGQIAIADIIDVLTRFEVPPALLSIMLRTPPDDMYVFDENEKDAFGFLGVSPGVDKQTNDLVSSKNLTEPQTWRGKAIHGELVSNGKSWYSWLFQDGSTIFQTPNGDLLHGTYRITERGSVCYLYVGSSQEVCRTPRQVDGKVRWYDDSGEYVSYITKVEPRALPPSAAPNYFSKEVSEHITGDSCALVVAARPTVSEARNYAASQIADKRFLTGYRSKNGWVAISIGTLKPHEREPVMTKWKASGRIPEDSYCATGSAFVEAIDLR